MWFVNLLNLIALQCAIVANCHLSRKLKCLRSKSGTFSKRMGLLGSNPITTKCHCRRAKKNYLTRGQVKTEGERTGAHCGVFTLNSGDFSPFVSIYGSNQSYEAIELAYENKQCWFTFVPNTLDQIKTSST